MQKLFFALSFLLASSSCLEIYGVGTTYGPFANKEQTYVPCYSANSNAYAISSLNNGLCMHSHACRYKFCNSQDAKMNLPLYSVDAKNHTDIIHAFQYAKDNDLYVSVKTTGHSYTGSSTEEGSLLVWMHNYEKDLTIHESYKNSCPASHEKYVEHDVISIGGGAVWDDVIEAVKDNYHVVTGGGRTVSAIGGWLQGGGLSFSSRKYGIGVDQAVDFEVVLTNGTVVTADACTNSDLYFALRGGGGGTYGVVTKVHYKVYPKTAITVVQYSLLASDYGKYWELISKAVAQFFEFWIEKSPDLSNDWCGGFFGPFHLHLVYCGTASEMQTKDGFFSEFTTWYNDNLDKSQMVENEWGSYPPSYVEYDSWYEYKGGAGAYQNPASTDQTGNSYNGIESMSARLMPEAIVRENGHDVLELLTSLIPYLGFVNYFLGGKINEVDTDETAVNPFLRSTIWSVFTNDDRSGQTVREFVTNDETGVCYNHHYGLEPDWRRACFGSHYDTLKSLQEKFDSDKLLNCWHCVGYQGEEKESNHKAYPINEISAASTYKSSTCIMIVLVVSSFILL